MGSIVVPVLAAGAAVLCGIIAAFTIITSESANIRIESFYARSPRKRKEEKEDKNPFADRLEGKTPLVPKLDDLVKRSGDEIDTNKLVLKAGGIMVLVIIVAAIFGYLIVGIGVAAAIPAGIMTFFKSKVSKREKIFSRQLMDCLPRIVAALEGGASFPASIDSIARHSPDPIGAEFARVRASMNVGVSVEDTMFQMSERMNSKDILLLGQAVDIQKTSGGKLSDIISNITDTIRYRVELRNEIKAITAEARASALLLGALPVAMLGMLSIMNWDYMEIIFTDPMGWAILGICVVMEALGIFFLTKTYKIDIE